MIITGNGHLSYRDYSLTSKSLTRHQRLISFELPRPDEYRRNSVVENLAPVLANLGQFVQQLAIAKREDAGAMGLVSDAKMIVVSGIRFTGMNRAQQAYY